MKTDTQKNILQYIQNHQPATAKDLLDLQISKQMIHRHLKALLEQKQIIKKGTPPRVFYFVAPEKQSSDISISQKIKDYIETHFLYFTPEGTVLNGIRGFITWTQDRDQNPEKSAQEYWAIQKKYDQFRGKNGLIDGTEKMKRTFPETYLTALYYFDFYSIERFGKTKLGALLLHAKQSQNVPLMREITTIIRDRFFDFLKSKKIDAVAFLPHSIERKQQLLPNIEKYLDIPLPKVALQKIIDQVPVAQKSLSRLEDRIANARNTIFLKKQTPLSYYKNLLLIDDAVGSGATLNEVAKKILQKGIAKNVYGIAFVGSFKGFDVISEV